MQISSRWILCAVLGVVAIGFGIANIDRVDTKETVLGVEAKEKVKGDFLVPTRLTPSVLPTATHTVSSASVPVVPDSVVSRYSK